MNNLPPQYYRNNKNWRHLLGKTGVVKFATTLEVASPELEDFLPYCFLVVELENKESGNQTNNLIEVMGEAKTLFKQGDKVVLELRKLSVPDNYSVIPYGVKACLI